MPDYYKGDPPEISSFGELVLSTARFHVPVYQRSFSWKQDEVKQLWEDIKQLKGVDGDKDNTFLGTIVLDDAPKDKAGNALQIIDGQQRITTLFLFCLCIFKRLKELDLPEDNLRSMLGPYRRPDWAAPQQEKQIKLFPREPDRKCLDFILKDLNDDNKIFLVTDAANFNETDWEELDKNTERHDLRGIESVIENCLIDRHDGLSTEQEIAALSELHEAIKDRVLFCIIVLDASLDPNEVFERLNDAGEPLSNFDLLRNHLMRMRMEDENGEVISVETSENVYNQNFKSLEKDWYWKHEQMTSSEKISNQRLKPYLFSVARIRTAEYALKAENDDDIETKSLIKGSDFHVLKNYYDLSYFNKNYEEGTQTARENIFDEAMRDLYEYKDIFSALTKEVRSIKDHQLHNKKYLSEFEDDDKKKIQKRIRRFSSFKIDASTQPYILVLFHSIINNDVNFTKGIELLDVIESFLIRRQICGFINKSVEIFRDLMPVNDKFDLDIVLRAIEDDAQDSWVSNQRLYDFIVGNDPESSKGIFNKKGTYQFLIEEYDKLVPGEPANYDEFEVDHVIPQAILKKDDESLWDGWDRQEYNLWLHKWANLVPLTSTGNKWKTAEDFQKAKEIFNNGDGNNFSSAAEVFALDSWTPSQVKARAARIANAAITRWPLPNSEQREVDMPDNIERIDEDDYKAS